MPCYFNRSISISDNDRDFKDSELGNDTSFSSVKTADFVIYEKPRGLELLGPNLWLEFVFKVSRAVHEAPVYTASQHRLYFPK